MPCSPSSFTARGRAKKVVFTPRILSEEFSNFRHDGTQREEIVPKLGHSPILESGDDAAQTDHPHYSPALEEGRM
jgi:hypothetical protein